jgi:hypothetical protein
MAIGNEPINPVEQANGKQNKGAVAILLALTGPLTGNIFEISKSPTTLGRDPTNDIVVSDPSISRHHAQILWQNGVWRIEKLAPRNTVTVNSRDTQWTNMNDHDTLGLGTGTTFLFIGNPAIAQPTVSPSYLAPPAEQSDQQNEGAGGALLALAGLAALAGLVWLAQKQTQEEQVAEPQKAAPSAQQTENKGNLEAMMRNYEIKQAENKGNLEAMMRIHDGNMRALNNW